VDLGEEVAAEVGLVVGVGLEAVEAVESDTTKLYTLHACMHAISYKEKKKRETSIKIYELRNLSSIFIVSSS
jgi:hypothetical protein